MKLRRFNNFLSIVIVVLGLYIALSPFLPQIGFWLEDKSPEARAPYSGELAEEEGSSASAPIPEENRIVIPSIQLDEPIIESSSISAINDGGTWRRPNTATPIEDSNTVIVGHRWFGQEVSTLYHLDKVLPGQTLAIYWEGKEILYTVIDKRVVAATAIEIEAPTAQKQLTIYTCDPIWTAKNRLVITAVPVDTEKDASASLDRGLL